MNPGPAAVAFVAAVSGTGKTTLIEKVLKVLKKKGFLVGAVKHSGHETAGDKEGSDSWRFTRAGSDITVLASRNQLAVFRPVHQPPLDQALLEFCSGIDIVLVEGFKEMDIPKIEIYRSGYCEGLYCRRQGFADPLLMAVASDAPLDVDVPVLDLNDPDEVCEFIVQRFIKGRDQ